MKKTPIFFAILLLVGCTKTVNKTQPPSPPIELSKKQSTNYNTPDECETVTEDQMIIVCIRYQEVKESAKSFFDKYPDYMKSREQEEKLLSEFNKVLEEPSNQKLSIYQVLDIAHKNLSNK